MANPALNFNYMVTETSYIRIVSGQIYNGTTFVPTYFLHNQANYNLELITNYKFTNNNSNYLEFHFHLHLSDQILN